MTRSRFMLIFYSFVFGLSFFISSHAFAAISLPWETTFDCSEWSQGSGSPTCNGIAKAGDWDCGSGIGEQITAAANYPGGKGGRGQRHWLGAAGDNSGGLQVVFNSSQKEFWARWYVRFENGMDVTNIDMHYKMLYLYGAGTSGIGAINFPYGSNGIRYYEQNGGMKNLATGTGGWYSIFGSGVSNGKWFRVDVHFKAETSGQSNGLFQLWVDGQLLIDRKDAQYGSPNGFGGFLVGSNHKGHNDSPKCMYVDYDDIAISSRGYIGEVSGDEVIEPNLPAPRNLNIIGSMNDNPTSPHGGGVLLFEEKFDDANLAGRGWYDNNNYQISTSEHISGSSASIAFRFPAGSTTPVSGGSMRRKFNPSNEVYISYYVKYSPNWIGSNKSYHPHEFMLLTTKESDYCNLAYTHLTAYIEQNSGFPLISIQDGMNIDESKINLNLTGTTENRAVAGCNGDSDGYGNGSCYLNGSVHWNGKSWRAPSAYFQNTSGTYYKSNWHFIEVYLKLNRIESGKGIADGVIKYWYDGNTVLDINNVVFRTAQNADMLFNQFVIGPYIGDGSPVDQTFWVDNLTLRTSTNN